MADNTKGDNSGNIFVEVDVNNIIVVDPNKTEDSFGKISERLVDHENLIMYANLEAKLLPRTKLAVGASPENETGTISIASINFLKPTKNSYLGSGYYDELTGENSTKFKGENQMLNKTVQPKDGSKPYITTTLSNQKDVVDNGLLGITSINIVTNSSFIPTVTIQLEDVQGRSLFTLGDNSPYAAFFNLPYPPFYLTLKGYFGQSVKYQLNLHKFNARYNSISGNYMVDLEFRGYKFNILNEIAMGHLLATPHMYAQRFDVASTPVSTQSTPRSVETQGRAESVQTQVSGANQSTGKEGVVTQIVAEKGYQKIVEVYSEYKAKGLISPNLPELTLAQLMIKLENFERNIVNSFPKVKVEPLTNIRNYKKVINQYNSTIINSNNSWFNTFINPKKIVLKAQNKSIYVYKELDPKTKVEATSLLKNHITEFNKGLASNPTLGVNGEAKIPNPIKYDYFIVTPPLESDIDWVETAKYQGYLAPTEENISKVKSQYAALYIPIVEQNQVNRKIEIIPPSFFTFDRFQTEINQLDVQANKKLSDYEASISDELLIKIEDSAVGLGFKPTVRNILAVIMASTEAFIRLMDDVHTNSWNVKYDPVRRLAILNNPSSAPSSDSKQHVVITNAARNENQGIVNSEEPVYPWPQFFVETTNDKGRFQLKYIADPSVVDTTKGADFSKWPEVEFVEEYMRGLTQRFNPPISPPPLENQRDTNLININAIEYPSPGLAYFNKAENKFFYEIWERQFLTSHYSGLIRANSNQKDKLIELNTETEANNIKTSLGLSSPYLTFKLKNYDLTSSNYVDTLFNISNEGTGRAYQDYIRDFFVTPYIRDATQNSFKILNPLDLGKIPQTSVRSEGLAFLVANASNDKLIIDTLPYTNSEWCLNNLNSSSDSVGNEVYNTKKTLTVFEPRNIISNFNDVYDFVKNRPVTNFSFLLNQNPIKTVTSNTGINKFYIDRVPKNFVATEGDVFSIPPTQSLTSGQVPTPIRTTTSILNTPYFVNAIQNGVDNYRNNDKNPYVQAAYLFLNSLPLASLRERYKTEGNDTDNLDYIASCFKKFGAIHKLPYAWVLKYGSIWHRYKRHKESGVDILQSAWKNFSYNTNYSPILNSISQTYSFTYSGEPKNVTLQSETEGKIQMQVGFYPKLINDFNVFYNGYELYTNYTNNEIQNSINGGMKLHEFGGSIINTTQNLKPLTLQTWSVLLPNKLFDNDINCNPNNNTRGEGYYVVPSFGSYYNQTNQCIDNPTITPSTTNVDLTFNTSVFNGSVRCLWSSPNYGYFDANQIAYPNPDSYINVINTGFTQSPMTLSLTDDYSKIEELFSVFDKKILDQFEIEFLNFCKPITDMEAEPQDSSFGTTQVSEGISFRNFQSLYKSLMEVPRMVIGQTNEEYFNEVINQQYGVFQNGIRAFMQYDIIIRYGNPSNYNRRVFDSYLSYGSTPIVTDPITFNPYVIGSLPGDIRRVTLQQSRNNNPLAWIALETEVGFSTILNVRYSNRGSYFTDFFIDNNIEFNEQNVILLSQLIKMYATHKLENPTTSANTFKNRLQIFLQQEAELQNNFLNGVLQRIRKVLPNQQQLPERGIKSVISGEQSKVENYEIFKALNDKWISGGDYTSKTLFEDIMILDRASRNIGDTIIIDIFDLKNMFGVGGDPGEYSLNQAMSVYTFISGILIKNNFTVMNLPSYVNFYNVINIDGTSQPNGEPSVNFANRMWGTFLDVDTRESGPKMVCFYAGTPSQYLKLQGETSRYKDDSFDMRRLGETPLIENQQGKKDWSLSNKCVAFNVDIGIRNQNIFYSFNVSQDNGTATSESINTQINMVDQYSGRQTSTQNNGLYNLYKNRSYNCTVVSLGNALLQPMMYFNLRNVPMFTGAYMITSVSHSIQSGNFQTTFTGVRQRMFDLPLIDVFLQSVNQNLLTKLEGLLKIKENDFLVTGTTNVIKTTNVVQKANNQIAAANSCVSNLNKTYEERQIIFNSVVGNSKKVAPNAFANELKRILPNNEILQLIIYAISYVRTFEGINSKAGFFTSWGNNLGTVSLSTNWGSSIEYMSRTYSCVNVVTSSSKGSSQPIAIFDSLEKYIQFMASRINVNNQKRIEQIGLAKYYCCFWPNAESGVSEEYYDNNLSQFAEVTTTLYKSLDSAADAKLANYQEVSNLKNKIKNTESKGRLNPSVTPTPSPVPANATQICPPPVINTFSPSAGFTGTVVQINGRNFESLKSIKVIGTTVELRDITILNPQTIRFVLPSITASVAGQVSVGKISITTEYGTTDSVSSFTFNPALQNVITSSPGGYQNTETQQQLSRLQQSNAAVNTNPQATGPITMIGTTVQLNESKTQSLNVKLNPQVTGWVLSPDVNMIYAVYELKEENNVVSRTSISRSEIRVGGQVTNGEFNITLNEVESFLINDIPKNEGKTQIDLIFVLNAYKGNEPPVSQKFPFKVWYTTPNQTQVPVSNVPTTQTLPTFPPQNISIVRIGEFDTFNGNGDEFYNVKKPAGGYITFKLETEKPFLTQNANSPEVLNSSTYKVINTTRISSGPSTNYTLEVEPNALGGFRLQVKYRPYGFTSPPNGEVLTQTILSEVFTL